MSEYLTIEGVCYWLCEGFNASYEPPYGRRIFLGLSTADAYRAHTQRFALEPNIILRVGFAEQAPTVRYLIAKQQDKNLSTISSHRPPSDETDLWTIYHTTGNMPDITDIAARTRKLMSLIDA